MTTLTDRLAYPNAKAIVLAELTAGEWLRFWTAAGGGYTNTYYAPTIAQASRTVSVVKENGASLTERASVALVDANAGSWYWDRTNARIYVHPTGSVSPYTKTIQGTLKFYFSNVSRIYNGIYYEGRISSLPSLSMRVEANFGDVGQLGGGDLGLRNEDGFFDALTDLNWNAGQCGFLLGVDDPLTTIQGDSSLADGFYGDTGSDGFIADDPETDGFRADAGASSFYHAQCAYADFEAVGTWNISGWNRADDEFVFHLEEKKNALKIKIPTTLYDKATYPNMRDEDVGKVIPYGYGKIYDIEPACIDVTTRQFKVAGHAIKQFTGLRVRDESTNAWVNVGFLTRDEATATFTIAEGDWDGSAAVAVDFEGRLDDSGKLMDNASDVVKDIITTLCGEAAGTIHASSFSDSYDALLIGTDPDGNPVSSRAVSLYLNEEKEAAEIISLLNACVGSYLFSDFDGKYRYVVFDPIPGDSAPLFEDSDIGLFEEMNIAEEIISSVKVEYQYRKQSDYSQIATDDRAEIQYLQGAAGPVLKVLEKQPISEYRDALNVASRTLAMDGAKRRTFRAKLNHRAWTLLPTGYVRVVYEARGVDDVFEILEVKRNLESMTWIDVVLGDLHGIGARALFLTADSPTFPASLGGGACDTWDDNWTDAQKAWARQNVGFLSDDYDFVSATDPDSFRVGVIAA